MRNRRTQQHRQTLGDSSRQFLIARQTQGGYRAYVSIELHQVSVTAGIAAHTRPVAHFLCAHHHPDVPPCTCVQHVCVCPKCVENVIGGATRRPHHLQSDSIAGGGAPCWRRAVLVSLLGLRNQINPDERATGGSAHYSRKFTKNGKLLEMELNESIVMESAPAPAPAPAAP